MPTNKISEISSILQERKRMTEEGFYAPVSDVSLSDDKKTLILTLEYPDDTTGEYRLSVPTYWESGRELVDFLNNVSVGVASFDQIENRSLPITRSSGSWTIDQQRLSNRDYKRISPILTFNVTDDTKNDTVGFIVDYEVADTNEVDHLELIIDDDDTNWADQEFVLDGFSGTFSEYSAGGATGSFTIELIGVSTDGSTVFKQSRSVVADNE